MEIRVRIGRKDRQQKSITCLLCSNECMRAILAPSLAFVSFLSSVTHSGSKAWIEPVKAVVRRSEGTIFSDSVMQRMRTCFIQVPLHLCSRCSLACRSTCFSMLYTPSINSCQRGPFMTEASGSELSSRWPGRGVEVAVPEGVGL